jgi:Cu2+-exporting ATPase
VSTDTLALAAGLAQASRHPLSRAICSAAQERGVRASEVVDVQEHPGQGLTGRYKGHELKLGSRSFCNHAGEGNGGLLELVFVIGRRPPVVFTFEDELRPDAAEVIAALKARGLEVRILSGDRAPAVRHAAEALGVATWQAEMTPAAKLECLKDLSRLGRKVLMVGDGLNDAPALAAGFTSMAPSSATDIGRTAADTIFFGDGLAPVEAALAVGRRSQQLSLQNFTLAVGYNILAVPIAMAGLASPLIAAVAMSTSSVIVIANALRLGVMPLRRTASRRTLPAGTEARLEERRAA